MSMGGSPLLPCVGSPGVPGSGSWPRTSWSVEMAHVRSGLVGFRGQQRGSLPRCGQLPQNPSPSMSALGAGSRREGGRGLPGAQGVRPLAVQAVADIDSEPEEGAEQHGVHLGGRQPLCQQLRRGARPPRFPGVWGGGTGGSPFRPSWLPGVSSVQSALQGCPAPPFQLGWGLGRVGPEVGRGPWAYHGGEAGAGQGGRDVCVCPQEAPDGLQTVLSGGQREATRPAQSTLPGRGPACPPGEGRGTPQNNHAEL